MSDEPLHRTVIESDEPVQVTLGDEKRYWFRISHALVELGWIATLGDVELRVYLTLAKHANWGEGGLAWPSLDRICHLTGAGKSAVYAALARLCAYPLLEKVERGYGRKRETKWRVIEPRRQAAGYRPLGKVSRMFQDGGQSAGFSAATENVEDRPPRRNFRADSPAPRTVGSTPAETPRIPLSGRTRSSSEQENRSSGGFSESREIEEFIASLDDDTVTAAKELVLADREPDVRMLLAKYSPRSHPTLARWVYERLALGKRGKW